MPLLRGCLEALALLPADSALAVLRCLQPLLPRVSRGVGRWTPDPRVKGARVRCPSPLTFPRPVMEIPRFSLESRGKTTLDLAQNGTHFIDPAGMIGLKSTVAVCGWIVPWQYQFIFYIMISCL